MTQEEVAPLEERYGLDDPLPVQYLAWLGGVLRGDLGWSGVSVAPVSDVLPARSSRRWSWRRAGSLIAIVLGIGLGTYAGARHNRFADHVTRVITVSGASLPLFWFALLMLILFYLVIPIAPLGRFDDGSTRRSPTTRASTRSTRCSTSNLTALVDALRHLALPAFVLGFEGMAVIARMMRSSLVEEMGEDYVDTARAKGLPERLVIRRHARRNALIPTVTVIGLSWGILLQGTVVVELVFRWPGMGRWATDAIIRGDRATIMAFVLVTSRRVPDREPDRRRRLRVPRPPGRARDVSDERSIDAVEPRAPAATARAGRSRGRRAPRGSASSSREALRSPTTVVGAVIIVLLIAMALFAPLLIEPNRPDPYQMPRDWLQHQRAARDARAPARHDPAGRRRPLRHRLGRADVAAARVHRRDAHGDRRRRDRQPRRLPRRQGGTSS